MTHGPVAADKVYPWIIVAALFMIGFVAYAIRFSFGVFLKFLEADFGWSRGATSSVFSLYMLLSGGIVIVGGWALDRYGARKVFVLSGFFTGLSLLMTSRVTAPWQLFLTYSMLLAVGTAPVYVNSMSAISRWFTKDRGLALGIVSAGTSVGMIAGSPACAYLIAKHGWQMTYLILSVITFFITIPCALLLRRPPLEVNILPHHPGGAIEEGSRALSLRQAARESAFWLVGLYLFLFSACAYAVITHVVAHAMEIGVPAIKAASLLSTIGGGSLLARILMGRASDSFDTSKCLLFSSILLAGAMVWLIFSNSLWGLHIFGILFGFAFGATAPLNAAIVGESFGLKHVGLIMGVIEIGWEVGAAIGPALAGHIFDRTGSYFSAFPLGGMAAAISAVVMVFYRKPVTRP
jgi:MFS family permease